MHTPCLVARYLRSKYGTRKSEEGGVEWNRVGPGFDISTVSDESDLSTNHSVIAVGGGQGRKVLDGVCELRLSCTDNWVQYLRSQRIFLGTGHGEELDESVDLIEVNWGVVWRWERLIAQSRADERRMSRFNGQDRGDHLLQRRVRHVR